MAQARETAEAVATEQAWARVAVMAEETREPAIPARAQRTTPGKPLRWLTWVAGPTILATGIAASAFYVFPLRLDQPPADSASMQRTEHSTAVRSPDIIWNGWKLSAELLTAPISPE